MAKISMYRLGSIAGISFFFQAGQPLILMPLAIANLQPAESALWLFWGVIVSFGMICDVGLKPTIARAFVFAAEAKPGSIGIRALEELTAKIYQILFIVSLAISCLFSYYAARNLINSTALPSSAQIATYILCLSLSVNIASLGLKARLQGLGGQNIEKTVDLIFNLTRMILVALAIIFTRDLICIALAYLMSALVLLVSAYLGCQKLDKPVDRGFPASRDNVKELFSVTGKTSILQISAFVVYNAVTIFVAQGDDPTLIAATLITVRFFMIIQQISLLPMFLILPDIAARWAQGDIADIYSKLKSIVILCLLAFCLAALVLYLVGNPLLALLDKNVSILTGWVFGLLFLSYFLEIHHSIHASFYMQKNKVPFVTVALIAAVLIVGIGTMLQQNIAALLLLQLLAQAVTNNWYPVYRMLMAVRIGFFSYLKALFECLIRFNFIEVLKAKV
jgi:Na+-driven multidrug efflux pump